VNSAGAFEAEARSEMKQIQNQQQSHLCRRHSFARAAQVVLGGDGASRRVNQNDMPPLAAISGDTVEFSES